MPYLEGGAPVTAETARRLACEASRVVMTHDRTGGILDVGRRTRAIPPALRRALAHRDRGCRFPGCGNRLCDAHHVRHWADGGETALGNLILLCRRHHRAVHERGFRVEVTSEGKPVFRRPGGRRIPQAPAAPRLPALSADPLRARLAREEISIDLATAMPTWDGGPCDYQWALDAWHPLNQCDGPRLGAD